MLSFLVKFVQTDRRTDRRTDKRTDGQTTGRTDRWTMVKQYALDLSMQGHKNKASALNASATAALKRQLQPNFNYKL